jgi:hypothetical protein
MRYVLALFMALASSASIADDESRKLVPDLRWTDRPVCNSSLDTEAYVKLVDGLGFISSDPQRHHQINCVEVQVLIDWNSLKRISDFYHHGWKFDLYEVVMMDLMTGIPLHKVYFAAWRKGVTGT